MAYWRHILEWNETSYLSEAWLRIAYKHIFAFACYMNIVIHIIYVDCRVTHSTIDFLASKISKHLAEHKLNERRPEIKVFGGMRNQ